jgi:catechol 2,3-dioxygenase
MLGLGNVAITATDASELEATAARLRAKGIDFSSDGRTLEVTDPWGTQVTLSVPNLSADEVLAR